MIQNTILFLKMFLSVVDCNLFANISVSFFNLLLNLEDCFDEIDLKATDLFFLFQAVITSVSGHETFNQPLLLEVFLKGYLSYAYSVKFKFWTLFAFFKCLWQELFVISLDTFLFLFLIYSQSSKIVMIKCIWGLLSFFHFRA